MKASHLESSSKSLKFGKFLTHPETKELLLLTSPTIRKANASLLKRRGLGFINAMVKMKVQVLGSFWLPGLHIYSASSLKSMSSFTGLSQKKMLVATTHENIELDNWYSLKGDPFMIVENKWETLEEYAASMKKKYRARFKKARLLKKELEFKGITSHADLQKCCELLAETLESKVVALPEDLSALLTGFKEWFGDDYQVIGALSKGEIIGFIAFIKTHNALRAMHYGAIEDAPDGLYSALMYEVIHNGILLGVKEINLGRTATEIKSTYGAVPRDNYFSFHTKNPLMKLALSIAQKRYKPKEYILRSPFQLD